MENSEKVQFVNALTDTIREKVLEEIKKGTIPENWDGIELRWLLADRAASVVMSDRKGPRYKAYQNTVIVKNL